MNILIKTALNLTMLLPLCGGVTLFAAEPMELLQQSVDKVISVLQDPELQGESHRKTRRDQIRTILEKRFDYREMSMRALGRKWRELDEAQRSEFTQVFSELLKDTYIQKMEKYTNEKVTYNQTRQVTDTKVVVETSIISQGVEYPIHYSMLKNGDGWHVYDVNIEGVGLIRNYRTQFKKTLSKESYEKLLELLRKKIQ